MAFAENISNLFLNLKSGSLEVRLAENSMEIDAAQFLRYKVFYEEMKAKADLRQTKLKRDGWTVETKDGRLSSQWEHTMLVTHNGVEVFTARQEENF